MRCPDANVLAEYVDDELGREQRAGVDRHIDDCVLCRKILSGLIHVDHGDHDDTATTLAEVFAADHPPSGTTLAESSSGRRHVHVIPGTMIGEYQVTGPIGEGGMGAVFAAVHPRIGKRAAIKVLRRDFTRDPSVLTRFENEARAVNAIRHANIVDIFAFGELPDGNPYFVMEHVEGETLSSWIRRQGPMSLERAMPVLRQVFDALAAAHEHGIIHRDLKPGNIMVGGSDAFPTVKVLDFGLAKIAHQDEDCGDLTKPGIALGTPAFMSPEQYRGALVDHRTDIYALGVLVYQMLCGRYPFEADTPTELELQHLHEAPSLPSSLMARLPPGIDLVLVTALAKDVAGRHASIRELRDALEACLPAPPPMRTRTRARMWLLGAAVTVTAALVGIVVVTQTTEPTAARAQAESEPAGSASAAPAIDAAVPTHVAAVEPPASAPLAAKEPATTNEPPKLKEAAPKRVTRKPPARRPAKPAPPKPRVPRVVDEDMMLLEAKKPAP